jgi:hypothetical protein
MGSKRNIVDKVRATLKGYKLDEKRKKKRRAVTKMLLKTRMNVDKTHTETLGLADIGDGIPVQGNMHVSGWGKTADALGASDRYRKAKLAINRTDEENERDLAP